jgi:hypothetical protein
MLAPPIAVARLRNREIGMAYLNFREAELSGSLTGAFAGFYGETAPQAEAKGFSALEWLVIALAEKDRLGSLRTPGRIAQALGNLFHLGASRRLANPQLEALRRLAVHAWHHGYTIAPSELAAFRLAGFSADQTETLLESIVGRRARRQARRLK